MDRVEKSRPPTNEAENGHPRRQCLPGLARAVLLAAVLTVGTVTMADETDGNRPPLPPSWARLTTETGKRLAHMLPGSPSKMPATFYPRQDLEKKWEAQAAADAENAQNAEAAEAAENAEDSEADTVAELRQKADRYLTIPREQWLEMMPDRSPAPICDYPRAGGSGYLTADPLNGAKNDVAWFEPFDIFHAPFSLRTVAEGTLIYERESDYPKDYAYPIAGYDEFPHYDGVPRKLAYIESKGIAFDGKPMKVYAANFVWGARLDYIIGSWRGGVLPELTEAYLATGDEKYAELIVLILERLAVIYPHMPLAYYNAIDKQTHEDLVRKAALHEPVGSHGWLGPSRFTASHTNFRPPMEGYDAFNLSKAYMAVAGAAAWGTDEDARAARQKTVIDGLFRELALLFHSYGAYNCVGNGIGMYAPGLIGLGVVLQDRYLYDGFNGILEEFLYDENYYDGISTEGSLNYAGMVAGIWNLWKLRADFDPSCMVNHPFVAACGKSRERISSELGVPSQHGDGPNGAFMAAAAQPEQQPRPTEVFGGIGITVLRGGDAAHRLEVFLHHDRTVGHSHPNMLGLQVHYRGVPIINFIGDARWGRFLELRDDKDEAAATIKALPYPKPMVVSEPNDHKGWAYGLHASPITKNLMIVDEYDYGFGRSPWRGGWGSDNQPYGNLRLCGGGDPAAPEAASLQVVEAEAVNLEPTHYQGVHHYRRSLVMVTRPDGHAYVMDVFHVDGGNRQLFLWHSPGDPVDSTFDPAAGETSPDLEQWLNDTIEHDFPPKEDMADVPRRHEWTPQITRMAHLDQVHDVRSYPRPPSVWRQTWRYDYAQWSRKTPSPDGEPVVTPDQWHEQGLVPVDLRLYGVTLPGDFTNYAVRAKSVYPATIGEHIGDQRYWGMVRFRDGLDYVGTFRNGRMRTSATFVHLLEPFTDGEQPAITSVTPLPPAKGERRLPSGAAALRVDFADGTADLVVLLPPGQGRYTFGNGLTLAGRCGLVSLDTAEAVVAARTVAATELTLGEQTILNSPAASFTGFVTDVEGDLSGDRSHSALVIRPDQAWPATAELQGRVLTVSFDHSRRAEAYTIERVEPADGGCLRLFLRGNPPFVDFFGEVRTVGQVSSNPEATLEPNEFTGKQACAKGAANETSPYLTGSRLAFPTIGGLTLTVRGRESRPHKWTLAEDVNLQELGVKPGVPFVVFPDFRHAVVRVAGTAAWRQAPPATGDEP